MFRLFGMKMQQFAELIWKSLLLPGDTVIDATVGAGHDTLFLAKLLAGSGMLYGYDIQEEAIQRSQKRLLDHLGPDGMQNIRLITCSHTELKAVQAKLIVYNLGYLPRSEKSLTTHLESTLESLKLAQTLIVPGGMISMMCYSGHEEGQREKKGLIDYASTLSKEEWSASLHERINHQSAPALLLISRKPHPS